MWRFQKASEGPTQLPPRDNCREWPSSWVEGSLEEMWKKDEKGKEREVRERQTWG